MSIPCCRPTSSTIFGPGGRRLVTNSQQSYPGRDPALPTQFTGRRLPRILSEHRAHIDAVLTKVRARIETNREAGDRFEAHKLQRQLREQEDERGRLEWLISRLDSRYREAWADLDIEQG